MVASANEPHELFQILKSTVFSIVNLRTTGTKRKLELKYLDVDGFGFNGSMTTFLTNDYHHWVNGFGLYTVTNNVRF